ncbi:MAG: hypothetical protein H6708_08825 [Kofleriaceae bacterium]|nr:hypothetical protein [Kofleriaceae bacterium]
MDAWSAAEAAAGVDAPAMASLPPTFERLVAASRALRDALAAEDEADGAPATPLDAAVRACLAGAGTVVDVPAPRRDLGYDPHRGDACRHAAARCLVAVAAVADAGPIPHEAESLLAMLGDLGMSVMFLGRNLDDGQYPWGASSVAQRATYAVDYLDRWLGRPPPPAPAEAPP